MNTLIKLLMAVVFNIMQGGETQSSELLSTVEYKKCTQKEQQFSPSNIEFMYSISKEELSLQKIN